MMAIAAWGQTTITFIAGEDVGLNETVSGPDQMQKSGINISSTSAAFKAAQYRFGKNSVTTFTSSIGNMTKIEFYCLASGTEKYGPGCFGEQEGYSYEETVGTWIGNAPVVQFTAVLAQVRASRIVITVGDGALVSPTIRPYGGTYYSPIQVTISCLTEGATIHYTTDGSDPTTSSPEYTTPFTLQADATVKAVATKDGEMCNVACETYMFENIIEVPCIAMATSLPDETVMQFGNPVTVTAQNNRYLYVKDDSGYALFYGDTGQTYRCGDIIPAGFACTKTTWACEPEFKDLQGFQPAYSYASVTPEVITADQVGHSTFAHYVMIRDATITLVDDHNYILTDAQGNTCPVYFGTMGTSISPYLDFTCDIIGIVGSYRLSNGECIYQLLPVDMCLALPVFTLCDMFDIPDETVVTFDHEVTVLAQMGSFLFLKDGDCYGHAYGLINQNYTTGDIIPPGWGGTKITWGEYPELKNPFGFQPPIRRDTLNPEVITYERFGHVTWGHYVMFRGVIIDYERKVLIDREGHEIPFHIIDSYWYPPTDLTRLYDVSGIVFSHRQGYNIIYQLLLIDYYPKPTPLPVSCFSDLIDLPEGTTVHFVTPLTATYQNGVNLYVADSCGGFYLMNGSIGLDFPLKNGDLIIGDAIITSYSGIRQLTPFGDWEKVGETTPVRPEAITIEEISTDMIHWYLFFDDVKIVVDDDGKTYIDDGTDLLLLYDKFHIEIEHEPEPLHPCDVNRDNEVNIADINCIIDVLFKGVPSYHTLNWLPDDFDFDANYDVWGFINIYHDVIELYPIRIVRQNKSGPWPNPVNPWDVNDDGEINISDINCIIDYILSH